MVKAKANEENSFISAQDIQNDMERIVLQNKSKDSFTNYY